MQWIKGDRVNDNNFSSNGWNPGTIVELNPEKHKVLVYFEEMAHAFPGESVGLFWWDEDKLQVLDKAIPRIEETLPHEEIRQPPRQQQADFQFHRGDKVICKTSDDAPATVVKTRYFANDACGCESCRDDHTRGGGDHVSVVTDDWKLWEERPEDLELIGE